MAYPVTTLSAAILGIWLVWLSIRVIQSRGTTGASLGDGGDETLSRRIRAQGNLSEYAPLGLILMFLAEAQAAPSWLVIIAAVLLVGGRLAHGVALSFSQKWVAGRVGGMIATFGGIIVLALAILWTAF